MELMLAVMAVAIVLGMLLRNYERAWRVLLILLSFGVTAAYYIFADRLM